MAAANIPTFKSWRPMPTRSCESWVRSPQRRASLVKLRASQINGCAFCVQFHILQAESLGIPVDKLNLVVVWREVPQFSSRERAALAWTEALTNLAEGVSDEVYAQASAEFSENLSHVRDRRDQCLEPLRRSLSLDAAGAQTGGGRRGRILSSAVRRK
jgi:AhpD family alkylhydroperoxidase